ncbi:MAG: hypothetical protein HYS53_00960 [Candidatus Aenigmarchaeota archaeon]|nr:hypothetical protein [Candidatus Aenigmarchaeota archaeon]
MPARVAILQEELFSTAVANATSANIKAGFDRLGVTLEGLEIPLHNQVMIRLSGIAGDVSVKELRDPKVPTAWNDNYAARAAITGVLDRVKTTFDAVGDYGVQIVTETNIPNPAGMGSSGASAAAGMKAAIYLVRNYVSDFELPLRQQIEAAVKGETAHHYDNVGPAVLGGLVEKKGDAIIKHRVPEWPALLAKPANVMKGSTVQGRNILSEDDKAAYENDRRITGVKDAVVRQFVRGDLRGLASTLACFEDPVERKRSEADFYGAGITPRFLGNLYKSLMTLGMPAWMSGAGPYTLAVVGPGMERMDAAKRVFERAYAGLGYTPHFIHAKLSNQGARRA